MHRQGPTLDTPLSPDEAKLLQPVHAVYPWSPDAGSPEPMEQRSRFEQALFARTAAQKGKADREALLEELLPFVEGNRRIFEMLDMPDWEKWVNPRFVSPQVLAMLHQAELYHSLSSSSYPEKVHIAKVRQRKGVEFVQNVWAVYAVVVLVVTLVYAIRFLSKQDALGCVVALLVVFMLMGLLLPAVQKVRQASFQGMMINNLRQIEFAMESARAANPDLLSRLQQRGDAHQGPTMVSGDAALAAGSRYRRQWPGRDRHAARGFDHHLATHCQSRHRERAHRGRALRDPGFPALFRGSEPARGLDSRRRNHGSRGCVQLSRQPADGDPDGRGSTLV